MTTENWALFQNLRFSHPAPMFAAVLVGRTEKMVRYVVKNPGQDPRPECSRGADWLIADGMTENFAMVAAEADSLVRDKLSTEQSAALERFRIARAEIVREAKLG